MAPYLHLGGFPPPSPPPTPPRLSPPPAHPPPCNSGPKLMHTKQGTTSKVNYILFNTLLSPVLLNKSGLARAKPVNFNSNFLNKCFSNYHQVQTWPVFAETVTNALLPSITFLHVCHFFFVFCSIFICGLAGLHDRWKYIFHTLSLVCPITHSFFNGCSTSLPVILFSACKKHLNVFMKGHYTTG